MQVERLGSYHKQIRSKNQTQLFAAQVFFGQKLVLEVSLFCSHLSRVGISAGVWGGCERAVGATASKWLFRHRLEQLSSEQCTDAALPSSSVGSTLNSAKRKAYACEVTDIGTDVDVRR